MYKIFHFLPDAGHPAAEFLVISEDDARDVLIDYIEPGVEMIGVHPIRNIPDPSTLPTNIKLWVEW